MRIFNEDNIKPEVILVLNAAETETIMEALSEASQKYKRRTKYKKILQRLDEEACIF